MDCNISYYLRLSLFVLLWMGMPSQLAAQASIDSLKAILKSNISDKERVDINNTIARSEPKDSSNVALHCEKALQLSRKIDYPEGISDAYYNLGISALFRDNYQLAREWYMKALHTAQGATYRKGEAKAYSGLGDVYKMQIQFPESLDCFSKALEIFTELGDEILAAFTIDRIGQIYRYQANYSEALKYFHLALDRLSGLSVEPHHLGDLHIDIGRTYNDQAQYPEAVDHYLSALEIFERTGDKIGKANAYNDIGVAFYEQKNYEKALDYYTKSLKLDLALGKEIGTANSYNNIALIHEHQNRLDSAIHYYQQCITVASESQNNYILAWAYNGMAIVYQKKQEYSQAFDYVQQAIALREVNGENAELAQSYNTLGKNYLALAQYGKALAIYRKSQLICDKIGNPLNLKDALEGISLSYEGLNEMAKAYPYHKRFKAVADSLASEENERALLSRTMQYEFDQKEAMAKAEAERKALLQQQEIQQQRYYIYASIAGFLALLVILVLVYRNRQKQKQTNRLLAKQNVAITAQKEQLQELDQMKSRFFTDISHEFRTPLTIIKGMIDQVEGHDKIKELIKRNSGSLLHLVNQILDLRKMEEGKLELDLSQGNVIQHLQYLMTSYEELAAMKGIQLHFLPREKEILMDFDREKLWQIVSNLLSNAIKFTPEGGHIYVITEIEIDNARAEHSQASLLLTVTDTGAGIPEEEQTQIFDRFYQVKGSTTSQAGNTGSGIGLTFTKELVTLMGGQISLQSKPEQGSSFNIMLPITRKAAMSVFDPQLSTELVYHDRQAVLAAAKHPMSEQPFPKQTGAQTLLIIEDNQDIQYYLSSLLEEHYDIILANDGQEGIDMALEHIPNLIISDVMMPEKDGLEVCSTLKLDERTSHIPIILLTAKASVESRIEGLQRGADAYLAKPFNEKELFVRLENLVELRRSLQQRYQNYQPSPDFERPPPPNNFEQEDAFMAKLQKTVEQNLTDSNFGPSQLCKAMGMSRSTLHLKIKALTNRSTSIFIRTIRLYKAKELLQRGDLNVTQVAFEVGFNDLSYFSKKFSEEFGLNPNKLTQA